MLFLASTFYFVSFLLLKVYLHLASANETNLSYPVIRVVGNDWVSEPGKIYTIRWNQLHTLSRLDKSAPLSGYIALGTRNSTTHLLNPWDKDILGSNYTDRLVVKTTKGSCAKTFLPVYDIYGGVSSIDLVPIIHSTGEYCFYWGHTVVEITDTSCVNITKGADGVWGQLEDDARVGKGCEKE
ncbi:hypothetical protein T439DRAFT_80879 [Meredithblackwellia eburnea MCA 4105]